MNLHKSLVHVCVVYMYKSMDKLLSWAVVKFSKPQISESSLCELVINCSIKDNIFNVIM